MLVDWQTIVLIIPVMIFSGLVHGALGLGFPMVATPIIAVFLDVKLAILLTLLPTATVNIASIYNNEPILLTVKKYRLLAISCFGGAIAGAVVLASTDASAFRLLLAALILLFLLVGKFGLLPRQWCMANPVLAILLVGVVGGFTAGTTNVMVAILLIYFLSLEVPRSEMVSAMNLCFLVGKLVQIVVFSVAGLLTISLVIYTVPLAICAFGALVIGQRLGGRISQDRYRKLLRALLAVLAAVLVWQYFSGR